LLRLPLIAAGCAILLSAGWAVLPDRTPRGADAPFTVHAQPASSPSSSVTRGTFVKTLRLNGLVEAVQFSAIRAPQIAGANGQQMIITALIPKGTRVKKGDLVIEFDRQNQLRTAQDKRAEWLDFEEQIRKKRAEHLAQQAKDETELKAAENAVSLSKLDVLKNEVLPRIEAEKNKLTLESSQARYAQLQETFALKRKAAEAEARILEVRRDRASLAMRQAEQNAERMAVRSPIDGLVVYRSIWRGGQPGDPQEGLEVWPGLALLDIVGSSAMRIKVKVNQADVDMLRVGQQANVQLDAYPEQKYQARLDQLAPIGVAGTFSPKVRTFNAIFTIDTTDATLMPDLSAAVDVELERRENVLLAPRDAVEFKDGKAFLRVKNGSSAEARPVTIGAMNDLQVVITGGAEAGLAVDTLAARARPAVPGGGL
jgi:multidrug efflux pump subunit AcrA (membrane-fusion protein)